MLHNTPKTILWLLALLFAAAGCQQEDIQLPDEQSVKGRIVLNLSDIDVYVDAETRATQTLSDFSGYVFTLNGKTDENVDVNNEIIEFTASTDESNNPIAVGYFDAGTYKLTASNQVASLAGKGCAYYEEESSSFHFGVGETANISISMGAPKNARVTLEQAESFSTRYTDVRVKLTAGGRSIDLGNATGCEAEAFFPAGTIDYTVTAAAKQGSHVTDISSASGTVTLTAGKHHVISLTANPATGEIIPLIEGTHTGEFD